MNELTTELKSLHDETLKNLKSSKADNTLRAYKSDLKISFYKLQPIGEFKIVLLNVVKFKKNVGISSF